MENSRISILGCGWLGVPLGKELIRHGYSVCGSVTSVEKFDELRLSGIKPYRILLNENSLEVNDVSFFDADVLIISIPPRRIENIEQIFPAQIKQLIPSILTFGIRKVVFISSTSVYPENKQIVTEDQIFKPQKSTGEALVIAERMLMQNPEFQTTVIRFGGLIGADRNPARFLQKSKIKVANVPVNLIHLDDCIGIIRSVIQQNVWSEILNACCPEHPLKKEFYGKAAEISGLSLPGFSDEDGDYKVVDSSKLIQKLGYTFKYMSPVDYLIDL